jgi:hypothetical protein
MTFTIRNHHPRHLAARNPQDQGPRVHNLAAGLAHDPTSSSSVQMLHVDVEAVPFRGD